MSEQALNCITYSRSLNRLYTGLLNRRINLWKLMRADYLLFFHAINHVDVTYLSILEAYSSFHSQMRILAAVGTELVDRSFAYLRTPLIWTIFMTLDF